MLKKYKRQYVGYLTNDNDIVVWINFIRNKDVCNDEQSKDIIRINDRGNNYWSIFINLTKKNIWYVY